MVDAPYVAVARYGSGDTATVCGTFPLEGPLFVMGSRVSLDGDSVLARMHADGESARMTTTPSSWAKSRRLSKPPASDLASASRSSSPDGLGIDRRVEHSPATGGLRSSSRGIH